MAAVNGVDDRLYTRHFFQMFAAVMLFMTGVALQFHFGQYVGFLGHGVDTLGHVLGISMIGALLIRLQLGRWIDRFGCKPVWLIGTLVMAVAVGSIQFIENLGLVLVCRTLSVMATAAVMTTVAVFAAQIAPKHRRAESIGIMGLAGFLGMMVGPTLGDWIFSGPSESIVPYRVFFSTSAALSLLAGAVIVALPLTPGKDFTDDVAVSDALATPAESSTLRIIVRYWPGAILLIAFLFSMMFCLQFTFLERLAEDRGFRNIKVFFLVYAPTAIMLRLLFRRVPERIGRTRVVFGGLVVQATGVLCLVGITTEWGLVLPAFLMGTGHSFAFPSMIDLAAEQLPPARRGFGTALALAAGDLGTLVGFFALGEIIDRFGYDLALTILAVAVLIGACVFAYARREAVFHRNFRSRATDQA